MLSLKDFLVLLILFYSFTFFYSSIVDKKYFSYGTINFQRLFKPLSTQLSSIKLPTEFEDLNKGYKDIHLAAIEENTRAQSSSAEWFNARKCRLTASNFGRVLRRKSAPSKKFLRSIFCPKSFSAPSVDYGRRNESKAKSKYLKKYPSRHFHECGLVINKEIMFLGATPDAKLCDEWQKGHCRN